MPSPRPAAVAGTFYPKAPTALAAVVRACLDAAASRARPLPAATSPRGDSLPPKAVIVPHAGYVYSGEVAAAAYAQLAAGRERIRRVVILGPTHRVALRGLALPSARAFATPLGEVPVDGDAVEAALALPQVCESDAAHALEHSLEVQLPFLRAVLGEFAIVPFAVGDASPEEVAEVIER
ncbi:MAG: AmmeMemoRadiSam system protein B, partial [Candidatus Levyibacteriota bacterium]